MKRLVQTIVVSNRKGVTGKTTVSVNLAAEFAAAGRRVLLVDLDSQNHCAVGLGMKVARGTPTAHDLFRDANATLDSAVRATAYPFLSMRVLFMIKSKENPELKIYGFVPVMVAEHINQHRLISGEIAHQFGAPKVLGGIRSDIKLAESFGAGQPIRAFAPRCRAAEDFAALWREVARVVGSFGEGPRDLTLLDSPNIYT